MRPAILDRASKLLVVGWTCAAVAGEVLGMAPGWSALVEWSLGAFLIALGLSFVTRRAVSVVLLFAYVYPVVILLLSRQIQVQFGVLWMAALVGAILADAARSGWHVPSPFRGPLVAWALVIVVGATIVVAREFDFTWALLHARRVSNSSIGGWPAFVATWSAHVALVLVLGILWFDWLASQPADAVRRNVLAPLAASFLAAAALSLYQLVVDLHALSPTPFANLGRATGGALDANVAGMLGAIWIGGALLAAPGGRRGRVAAAIGVGAGWIVVWASGSRSAFGAAVLITAVPAVAFAFARGWRRTLVSREAAVVGAAAALAVLVFAVMGPTDAVGPIQRLRETLPEPSVASVRAFAVEMWNRNTYGEAATRMIETYPWFGTGVGIFHVMFADFARLAGSDMTVPDNAQNWYRHQLAEFGVIGSLAWIAWIGVLAAVLFRRAAPSAVRTWAGRAALVAFGLMSLVGMPGQHFMVVVTFWTLVCCYVSVAEPVPPARPTSGRTWAVVGLVVLVYGIGTAAQAVGPLRVPARAQRIGWPYEYGFYPVERDADGAFRWTARHAVAVVDAPGPEMDVSVAVNYAGVDHDPVGARVWVDGRKVIDANLSDHTPVTARVRLPASEPRVRIEVSSSRTVRPADLGSADDRELGVMVRWRFRPD